MQMSPMALQQPHYASPPPPPPPHHHMNGSVQSSMYGTGQVLDYLENQVRGMDIPLHPQSVRHSGRNMPQPHLQPQPVPYTPGPPSMLSALDELGVQGMERRVITLPPIIQPAPSLSSRRGPDRGRGGAPLLSSQSSGSTSRSVGALPRNTRGYRDASPPRRGILREYSDESDWESRRGRAAHRDSRNSSARRAGGSRPRARSRDDLMNELYSKAARREKSYSLPRGRRGSLSSDDEGSSRRNGGKRRDWSEKPPSYFSIENQQGRSSRNYSHISVRPTHHHWHTLLLLHSFILTWYLFIPFLLLVLVILATALEEHHFISTINTIKKTPSIITQENGRNQGIGVFIWIGTVYSLPLIALVLDQYNGDTMPLCFIGKWLMVFFFR